MVNHVAQLMVGSTITFCLVSGKISLFDFLPHNSIKFEKNPLKIYTAYIYKKLQSVTALFIVLDMPRKTHGRMVRQINRKAKLTN